MLIAGIGALAGAGALVAAMVAGYRSLTRGANTDPTANTRTEGDQ
jgi:hypothetical protein